MFKVPNPNPLKQKPSPSQTIEFIILVLYLLHRMSDYTLPIIQDYFN